MNAAILAAVITGLVTLLVAVISHFFARRRDYQLRNLQFKLDKYGELFAAFAEIGTKARTKEGELRFATALNTINLFAGHEVLLRVYELVNYINAHREMPYSVDEQDEIVKKIVLAIRRDLGEAASDLADFPFRMFST